VWQAFVCHLAGFQISIFTVFFVQSVTVKKRLQKLLFCLERLLYTSFIHQRTGSKVKKGIQEQTQINLTNMQFYSNFTVQPGLKVIKQVNINSITQLTYSFNISSILLENVM